MMIELLRKYTDQQFGDFKGKRLILRTLILQVDINFPQKFQISIANIIVKYKIFAHSGIQ